MTTDTKHSDRCQGEGKGEIESSGIVPQGNVGGEGKGRGTQIQICSKSKWRQLNKHNFVGKGKIMAGSWDLYYSTGQTQTIE